MFGRHGSQPAQNCWLPLRLAEHFEGGPKTQFYITRVRHVGLLLPEPKLHVHLAVHRRRCCKIFLGTLCLADAAVKLTHTEVAAGDERAHAVQLGECQGLPVVSGAAFDIEPVWMRCYVTE